MAYDGHILCHSKKCRRVLYLGKHKDGQFWPGQVDQSQFAKGLSLFITEHFIHGKLSVFGDDSYERYLESCPESEWPITVFIEIDESGDVKLVDQDRSRRF